MEEHTISNEMLQKIRNTFYEILKSDLEAFVIEEVAKQVGLLLDFPLTIRQVATLTGRKEDNIYKMCQRNKIPYTKNGAQIHINLRDINSSLICVQKKDQCAAT